MFNYMQVENYVNIRIVRIFNDFCMNVFKYYKCNKPNVYTNFGMFLCVYTEFIIIIKNLR